MCVHIENSLFSELRIAYCVRAGETATFQLRYPPEKSRFQTGFTLAGAHQGKTQRQLTDLPVSG